jgi:flagellum-specific peptidoglycan hydrolase FlgJ
VGLLDSIANRSKSILGPMMPAEPAAEDQAIDNAFSYGDPYMDYYANMIMSSSPSDTSATDFAFSGGGGEVDPFNFAMSGDFGQDPVAMAVNRTNANPYQKQRMTIKGGADNGAVNPYTNLENRPVNSTPQQESFLQRITPIAEDIEKRYGIPLELTIAIAATETGWGTKVSSGNNWFGLKAQAGKPKINLPTTEVENGRVVPQNADFTAYASMSEAADDFAQLLTKAPRYKYVMELARTGRVAEMPKALFDAGYGTDPQLVTTYRDIMTQSNVNRQTNKYSTFSRSEKPGMTGGSGSVLDAGRKYIGKPYIFGAQRGQTTNFDCSSFVSQSFKDIGVKLTPYTDTMFTETDEVRPEDARPGDIVLWRWDDPSQPGTAFSHVALYKGNGQILHATRPGGVQDGYIQQMAGTPFFRRIRKRG